MSKSKNSLLPLFTGVVGVIVIVVALFWGLPVWNVWKQGLSGEAALAKAEQTKRITIETARAEVEAAELRAKAIEIMGEAAKNYPEYRLQEFMGAFAEALKEGNIQQIIYVPTEANIPILEAGKRAKIE
ncbi:hypothetical protein [Endozoicomonas lisbonensis]|uniref:Regulator of protease activity HflC (Stomatin/prohibitin superfamily) n=1 Tax=Endozoicomonas lisbonensis TaxID=3120522 RepID=A0ABV2SL73_9GAMM